MKAIVITGPGGPDALSYESIDEPRPDSDEVLVDVDYAGVNFIDTYQRSGAYKVNYPFIPGLEGVGRVRHDPTGRLVEGTLVAWCNTPGSYAQSIAVPTDRLVAVPCGIDKPAAATMLLKGMTAHYLVNDIGRLTHGSTCLITAGAGGVGLIATQLAVAQGATVFTVTSTQEKKQRSLGAGATRVFSYGDDLAHEVLDATDGLGVDVAFDGVGRTTFNQCLNCVKRRGMLCLFGAASGPVPPIDPQELNKHGSLFLTRPTLADYIAGPDEFTSRAQAISHAVAQKELTIDICDIVPLAKARKAHELLESRSTIGSVVLKVER